MYTIKQYKNQIISQFTLYNGSLDGLSEVEAKPKSRPQVEGPQTSGDVARTADDAHNTAEKIDGVVDRELDRAKRIKGGTNPEGLSMGEEVDSMGEGVHGESDKYPLGVEVDTGEVGNTGVEVSADKPPEQTEVSGDDDPLKRFPEEYRDVLMRGMTDEQKAEFEALNPQEQAEKLIKLEGERLDRTTEMVKTLAVELGMEEILQEAGDEKFLEGLTPEQRQEYFDGLIAKLEAKKEANNRLLSDPNLKPDARRQIQTQNDAIGMMQNSFQNGGNGAVNTGPGGSFYSGDSGNGLNPNQIEGLNLSDLTTEQLKVGHDLANWIHTNNFPVYNGQPFFCGENVGNALINYGIEGLPTAGRDGHKWATILGERPSQFRKINCTPQEAPAGAIISYEKGVPGGSKPNFDHGHVEIKASDRPEGPYYFGKKGTEPGGSNKNFGNSYSVWLPISKTA